MANPSDKGARGPAGPLADPLRTEAPAVGSSAGAPSATPSGASPAAAQPADPTSGFGGAQSSPGMSSGPGPAESARGRSSSSQRGASASETAGSLGAGLKDTAQTAAEAVRQQAAQFAEDVGHELSKTSEAQKARGVEAIRQVARAIDSAGEELESQSPQIARTVHEAARRVDGLSDSLSNRNINDLIDSASQLARSQPALFFGGSIAAGFALARFLKSSARQRSNEDHDAAHGYDRYQGGNSGQGSTGYDPYQR
jgi:hypothetical protein